ncbi:4-(cytidine 5'-diphospho)-2-C-methyl-D-erythritol kinase [[Clostridium] polysaccharolyticum]|uniref:4-diphosphocytidyl-2-C-methyl-D-erythritol kinase n=1 Tax=[Clostridium] polysaccharolyticum TaxID=29364 RepID=A0A1I0FYB0_9FIRM|nr:4-(cytidine 5'-diphospho)-2-C-methyl-D-erythritol kinase [[Clostridium] polysaccharolyticum]SET63267.1 4-diphosphocytidyl-2-C-methyl-D-erythritol kinase [[Clostridium] polysaccharolyticum]
MITTLQGKAFGKINIGLDVLRKRTDGYHDVKMIMQTVSLYDRITITRTSKSSSIALETNLSFLPSNENNIVYKAAKLIKDEFGIKDGLSIKLEKHIPVAAGMAGGSTDAAAALEMLNTMYVLNLSKEELMKRALKLGADVPYCVLKGTALSEGIGEKLTPLKPLMPCFILIVKPPVYVSTKFVYENLKIDQLKSHPDIDGIVTAIEAGELETMSRKMENVLETVTEKNYPVISSIKETMIQQGAISSLMSGSGPTVFGIFESEEKINQAASFFKTAHPSFRTYVTKPVNST